MKMQVPKERRYFSTPKEIVMVMTIITREDLNDRETTVTIIVTIKIQRSNLPKKNEAHEKDFNGQN